MAEGETSSTPSPNKGLRSWRDKFQQQELEAWQPIFTAEKVWIMFIIIGGLFIAMGVPILITLQGVVEHKVDYTTCARTGGVNGETCQDYLKKMLNETDHPTCNCLVPVKLSQNMTGKIYMYYGLDNFYQNHRRYVVSRDDRQLVGKIDAEADSDCNPYATDENDVKIAPCGSIANSMFNDTLKLKTKEVFRILNKTGIAWPSDRTKKFQNPENWENTVKPPYWKDTMEYMGGYEDEAFIVWMRTAAFPSFRKLYAMFDGPLLMTDPEMTLEISYNYPVDRFDGKKYMILSNTSFFGGKNNFLGIAYITVGSICVLLGIMFFIIHQKFGKGQNFQNTQS